MATETSSTSLALVDEHGAASALDISVHSLRQDRVKSRRIPYFKIGGLVRYDLERVRLALSAFELGGPVNAPARRRPATP